jgi:hypothetical protein
LVAQQEVLFYIIIELKVHLLNQVAKIMIKIKFNKDKKENKNVETNQVTNENNNMKYSFLFT